MVPSERLSAFFLLFLLSQTTAAESSPAPEDTSKGNWWIPTICVVIVLVGGVVTAIALYICLFRKKSDESAEFPDGISTSNPQTDQAESGAVTPSQQTPCGPPSVKVPRRMKDSMIKPGKIEQGRFTFQGPLKVDAGVKGPVRHALQGEKSHSLKDIMFDDSHNMVRYIGSNVECRETSPVGTVTMEDNDNTLEALKSKEQLGLTKSADILLPKSKEMVVMTKSSDGPPKSREIAQSGDLKVDKTQERTIKWSLSKSKERGGEKKRQRKSWDK